MKHLGNIKASKDTIRLIKSNKCQLDFCHQLERKDFEKDYNKLMAIVQSKGLYDDDSGEWLGIWAKGKCVLPHTDDALSAHTVVWFTQCTKQAWLLSTSTPVRFSSEIVIKAGDIFAFDSRTVHALVVEPRCSWALIVNDVKECANVQ